MRADEFDSLLENLFEIFKKVTVSLSNYQRASREEKAIFREEVIKARDELLNAIANLNKTNYSQDEIDVFIDFQGKWLEMFESLSPQNVIQIKDNYRKSVIEFLSNMKLASSNKMLSSLKHFKNVEQFFSP